MVFSLVFDRTRFTTCFSSTEITPKDSTGSNDLIYSTKRKIILIRYIESLYMQKPNPLEPISFHMFNSVATKLFKICFIDKIRGPI